MKTLTRLGLILACVMLRPAGTHAQYEYSIEDGLVTINKYTGPGGDVVIPDTIEGMSVTAIGNWAFAGCATLTSAVLPANLTSIGEGAFLYCDTLSCVVISSNVTSIAGLVFAGCPSLTGVYFKGNAVGADDMFSESGSVIVYYRSGATGWDAPPGGRPAVLWSPAVQGGASFGVHAGGFGFTFTNAGNPMVVIEASTNLANSAWSPMATNTLTGGSSSFSDPHWTNHAARFYRLCMP
jgi:hypothetical protein